MVLLVALKYNLFTLFAFCGGVYVLHKQCREIAKHNMPSLPLPLFPPHINQFSEKYTLRNTLKKYIHEKIRIIHIDKCSITTWPTPPSSSHQSVLTIFKTVSCKCFLLIWIEFLRQKKRIQMFQFLY